MFLDAGRDRWILWAPIFFGTGIAANFSLSIEPEGWVDPICKVTALSVAIYYRHIQAVIFAMLAFALFLAGFSNVKFRGDRIEAPILSEPLGPAVLSGRILRIEAFPKCPQVLLDQLTWSGIHSSSRLPEGVLVRLYQDIDQPIGHALKDGCG